MSTVPSGSILVSEAQRPSGWFSRRGYWIPPQGGSCTSCGTAHTGAVLEGDRCSRCPGELGPTVGIGK